MVFRLIDSYATVEAVTAALLAESGHTVVYKLMISVVTEPILAGQFVMVGTQDVIV